MTAPTTHDTRTVILGDEEIMAESRTKWDAQQFAHGARFARSIYEPHVAKLEAEIADHKAAFDTMSARYREQLTAAEFEIADWRASAAKAASEECSADEVHCTCVGPLRAEIAALKAMVPKWVSEEEFMDPSMDWWEEVTVDEEAGLILACPMIPLPAAPTQGGGESL